MNEEYKVVGPDVISCCGWCFPGSSIFTKYPALAGKKISHGICRVHKLAFEKELEAMQHLSRPVGK